MKNLKRNILMLILTAAISPVVLIVLIYLGAFGKINSEEELKSYRNATASQVLSQEGELIGKIFIENRTNISFDQIPPYLVNALIATEDARFFEHRGIDPRSLFRVLIKSVLLNKEGAGGGSTITQQLAKNMFGRINAGLFTMIINKTKESILAYRLEKVYSKEEILTLYLNTVSFGENVYGIGAAARRYFSREVESLTIEESAVLVGILKANNLYNPRLNPENAKKRRNIVLRQMQKYNFLEQPEADSLVRLPLVINYSNTESEGPADYFLYHVKNEVTDILQELYTNTGKQWDVHKDGLIITTTLNLKLQNHANASLHEHLSKMQEKLDQQYSGVSYAKSIRELAEDVLTRAKLSEKGNEIGLRELFEWSGNHMDSVSVIDSTIHDLRLLHAGMVAIDPGSGAVKAWAGGIDFKTHPYDQVLARRQMGSIFKPILFAAALEDGIRPCFYLDNDSVSVSGFEGWKPDNFDHTYGGKYSLAGALMHSMNIPAFNLFIKTGYEKLDTMWKRMGFSFNLINTPSLPMGTAEADLQETAIAYSVFANGGYKITPYKILSIKSSGGEVIWVHKLPHHEQRVLSARTSLLMSYILQKAVKSGTGSQLGSVYGVSLPVAGKTGTTQNYADAWFSAFNPSLVIVSRVGASLPSVHSNQGKYGTGSALALPLVGLTLREIQQDKELMEQLITRFPELPPELESELECPDFKEDNVFDNFLKIFKKDRIVFDTTTYKPEIKKRSFFKRVFGRKNKPPD